MRLLTSFALVFLKCDARFEENDWDVSATAGEDYLNELSELDQASKDKLKTLQAKFTMLLQNGW